MRLIFIGSIIPDIFPYPGQLTINLINLINLINPSTYKPLNLSTKNNCLYFNE